MAESHKFTTVEKLREAFPDAPVAINRTRNTVSVYNRKDDKKVPVTKGQFVVKIADRYEVHDEEPDNAKPAEAPKAAKKADAPKKAEPTNSEETPKAVEGNTTVVPEELASPPGPQSK